MGEFLYSIVSIFSFFSPLILVGKFLDWHLRRVGQEKTKDVIGDLYLHSSYGTIFKNYALFVLNILDKKLSVIYIFIVVVFLLDTLAVNYFLFRDFKLISSPYGRFFLISLALSFVGVIDFLLTKRILKLAADGKVWWSIAFSIFCIYMFLAVSNAVIAVFSIGGGFDLFFYVSFLWDRFLVMLKNPFGSSFTLGSVASGYYVHASVLSFPVVVISSSILTSSIAVAMISSKFSRPLIDYLAERIFSSEEKSIHLKLSVAVSSILSVILAAFYQLAWNQ